MTILIYAKSEEIEAKSEMLRNLLQEENVDLVIFNETNNRCMLAIDKSGVKK